MGEGRDVAIVLGLVAAVAIVVGVTIWVGGSDGGDGSNGGDRGDDAGGRAASAGTTSVVDPGATPSIDPADAAAPTTVEPPHDLADGAVLGGSAWLPSGGWFDLDTGDQGSAGRPPATDVYVESGALRSGENTFVTLPGALPAGPGPCDVTALAPSLPLDELAVGTPLCVQTNGGRTAAVEILVVEADEVRFSFDVWELG